MLPDNQQELLNAIEEALIKYPTLRLGQLLHNVTFDLDLTDLYYIRDEHLTRCIKGYSPL